MAERDCTTAGKQPATGSFLAVVTSSKAASTPSRIRTCDLRIRSPLLYPAELWARVLFFEGFLSISGFLVWGVYTDATPGRVSVPQQDSAAGALHQLCQ